ncbi:unnamed protein product [Blepharisma stoltei]|uniref:C2 NT-type domain-containing protein n=1 Tax=Blepharisma stoltei TaxID=1481888 RepID=A0AAU9IQ39_9CILI|nr:unnamed protein product [Blepharisma stoltei]
MSLRETFERIVPKKHKFNLDIQVHYVKAQYGETGLIKILVKRGKQKQETQPMPYNSLNGEVILEYPISFIVHMIKRGKNWVKKHVSFQVLEIRGKSTKKLGEAALEFSQIASTLEPFTKFELVLAKSPDKAAKICVSVDLFQLQRHKRAFGSTEIVPSTTNISTFQSDYKSSFLQIIQASELSDEEIKPVEAFEKPEFIDEHHAELGHIVKVDENYLEKSEEKKLDEEEELDIEKSRKKPRRYTIPGIVHIDGEYKESFSPVHTFLEEARGNIVDPKDSTVESESSSSDEEAVVFESGLIVGIPSNDMKDAVPNQQSKKDETKEKENEAGLTGRRGTCAKCQIM